MYETTETACRRVLKIESSLPFVEFFYESIQRNDVIEGYEYDLQIPVVALFVRQPREMVSL